MEHPTIGSHKIEESFLLIVRGAKERTEMLSFKHLSNLFGAGSVQLVNEIPFSRAIQKSFGLGIDSGKDWMLCIDADVLLDYNAIKSLLKVTEGIHDHVFEVQGLVRDKFIPVNRPAGNHLYRMRYAEEAIKCIPKEGTSLRPESTMLKNMALKGFPWYQSDVVVGVHDFEQYYKDIFRKCFLHAKKHSYVLPKVMPYWLKMARTDPDFEVAILAAAYAQKHRDSVAVSKNFGIREAEEALSALKLEEKDTIKDISNTYVEDLLRNSDTTQIAGLQELMAPSAILNKVADVEKPKRPTLKKKVALSLDRASSALSKISNSLRKE